MIKAMIKEPLKDVKIVEIEGDYDSIRGSVKGLIEGIYDLEEHNIMIWGNEESKLEHMMPNLYIYDYQDIACGTLLFMNYETEENGDETTADLTEEQINIIKTYCSENKIEERDALILLERIKEAF